MIEYAPLVDCEETTMRPRSAPSSNVTPSPAPTTMSFAIREPYSAHHELIGEIQGGQQHRNSRDKWRDDLLRAKGILVTDTHDMHAKMKLATDAKIWEPGGPVTDWTTDYDIRDEEYVENPVPIWAEMREKCPIAHT
ncbi:hypothetical protein GQR58_030640 [Nymphon striatum]|nr:hypothetical protein GQR58_030640 [Nymphon striatum]